MVAQIICTAITAVASIIVAVVGWKVNKANKLNEEHFQMRIKESDLSLQLMSANMKLTKACANAILGKHNNGNVEDAYESAEKAQSEYLAFKDHEFSETLVRGRSA